MAGAIADLIEPGRQDLEAAAELPSGLAAAIGRDRGQVGAQDMASTLSARHSGGGHQG